MLVLDSTGPVSSVSMSLEVMWVAADILHNVITYIEISAPL